VTAGGHPTAPVARDLGILPHLLRRWKHEVAGDPVAGFPGKGRRKPPDEERARLTRDVARVPQERELLTVWRRTSPRRCQEGPGPSCASRPYPGAAEGSHPGGVTIG
jgi:hypothetical protein